MTLSVRSALTGLWVLVLSICVGLAFFLSELYKQSGNNQIKNSANLVQQAGDATFERYQSYLANSERGQAGGDKPERVRALNLLLSLVLTQFEGIEGGFWTQQDGFAAYSFPTYGGSSVKKDLPTSELRTIQTITSQVISTKIAKLEHVERDHRSLIIYARPVKALGSDAAVWTMGWANVKNTELFTQVVTVLIVLFLCSLISGVWLTSYLFQWSNKVSALENSINGVSIDQLPQLELTGQKELDRVVVALNQVNQRLKESQASSLQLSRDLARADKLSALGRMVAGFAHEIRNPLATIILSAENALDGVTGKQERLVKGILSEAQGLEALLQKLLAVAKLNELKPSEVNLAQWWQQRIDHALPLASQKQIQILADAPDVSWSFDEESLSRAIGNLILNAIQNTSAMGWIRAEVKIVDQKCILSVEDSGAGVPEKERETIFEPLVSGRTDGVGIGLTIVKEIIDAHKGSITCKQGNAGAKFEVEIPWLKS